jgi:hypothetical protein
VLIVIVQDAGKLVNKGVRTFYPHSQPLARMASPWVTETATFPIDPCNGQQVDDVPPVFSKTGIYPGNHVNAKFHPFSILHQFVIPFSLHILLVPFLELFQRTKSHLTIRANPNRKVPPRCLAVSSIIR